MKIKRCVAQFVPIFSGSRKKKTKRKHKLCISTFSRFTSVYKYTTLRRHAVPATR